MEVIAQPEIVSQQSDIIQIIVWLGGLIVIGLFGAVTVLWRENRKQAEYIREQDKQNMIILNDISSFCKTLGSDIVKIDGLLVGTISTNINEIKSLIKSLEKIISK